MHRMNRNYRHWKHEKKINVRPLERLIEVIEASPAFLDILIIFFASFHFYFVSKSLLTNIK